MPESEKPAPAGEKKAGDCGCGKGKAAAAAAPAAEPEQHRRPHIVVVEQRLEDPDPRDQVGDPDVFGELLAVASRVVLLVSVGLLVFTIGYYLGLALADGEAAFESA